MDHKTEIRFEVDAEDTYVLDGVCQATGKTRTEVLRQVLREWSSAELHRAKMVCRVAGCNPQASDTSRQ
jgi:hypothetical protein